MSRPSRAASAGRAAVSLDLRARATGDDFPAAGRLGRRRLVDRHVESAGRGLAGSDRRVDLVGARSVDRRRGIDGFWTFDVKPFGPVHRYVAPVMVGAFSWIV